MKKIKNINVKLLFICTFLIVSCNNQNSNSNTPESTKNQDVKEQSDNSKSNATEVQKEIPKEWVIVKTWSGTGMKKTEVFAIKEKNWRIDWSFNRSDPSVDFGLFIGMYCRKGDEDCIDGDVFANIANEPSGKDTSYFSNTGDFVLDINATNCNWQITVEEERKKE